MATMTIPKRDRAEVEPMVIDQKRPKLERYQLQVDRQTKSSFKIRGEAEKIGAAIKKSHPKVQVAIYDSEESSNTVLTG